MVELYEKYNYQMFIMTPFYREIIHENSYCQEEPEIPFKEYDVFVFNSLIEPELRKIINFESIVYRDIPYKEKMRTTLHLTDMNGNIKNLSDNVIKIIQEKIDKIIKENSKYFLFFQINKSLLFRPWLHNIIKYIKFQKQTSPPYYLDEAIQSKMRNGNIYLNLSDDLDYINTTGNLITNLEILLEEMYKNGVIPNEEVNLNGDVEEIYEILTRKNEKIEINEIKIPNTILNKTFEKINLNTVYELIFKNNDEYDIMNTEIGCTLIKNLKKFTEAEEIYIIRKDRYEITFTKDDKIMETDIDIEKTIGNVFVTKKVMGLLVLKKLGYLDEIIFISDKVTGNIGIWLPYFLFGNHLNETEIIGLLENFEKEIDIYEYEETVIDKLKEMKMKIIDIIDILIEEEEKKYIFVKREQLITQRSILRSLEEDGINIFIEGKWVEKNLKEEEINKIVKSNYKGEGKINRGPYGSYYLNFRNIEELRNFDQKINNEESLDEIDDKEERRKDVSYFIYG
jgi:hypothetical protein